MKPRFGNWWLPVTFAFAAFFVVMPREIRAGSVSYTFMTLDNSGDPAFNQLLGVNNAGTIAGYFGDGAVLPNKGYTLTPPYTAGSYTNENFPASVQTQVVAINSLASPTTVGFWIDGSNNNFGFVDVGGSFTSVQDPNTPTTSPTVNQLLGVNNSYIAVGFYVDSAGNAQGYTYDISTMSFTAVSDPNGIMTTATDINNSGWISGFYTDAAGNVHGFLDKAGTFTTLDDPNGTNTMVFGLNNAGEAVGSFVDSSGTTDGFVYNYLTGTWQTVDDPLGSPTAAFNVTGTTTNGINDRGQLVGFYSDGTNVNGFLATPTPEPISMLLMGIGLAAAGLWARKNSYHTLASGRRY